MVTPQIGPSAKPANRPPVKGDRAQLVRATPLFFRETVYRQGAAGEQFEVIEYHPDTKKVYLLSHGTDGKPLACNVPAEAVTIIAFAPQSPASAPPAPPAPTARPQSRYSIVRRWPIPNGGEGKVIVIPPSAGTESGMTALADQLRADTASDRNAFVYIFDDQRAAQMRDRIESLTPAEEEFYDRHYMGNYFRNGNNGVHEMEMHPTGMNGPSKTITF